MLKLLRYETSCNTYFLIDENNDAILVDPGYSLGNSLINKINRLGIVVKHILITHGHYDHIAGLKSLISIYKSNSISISITIYLSSEDRICLTDNRYNLSYLFNEGSLEPVEPENLVLVYDNMELNLLGEKIKVIATPFHTRGSVCYYLESMNLLFSGDTLFRSSIGRTDLVGAEPRKIKESLLKLTKLPLNTKILPGHDSETTLEREMKYNRYILDIL